LNKVLLDNNNTWTHTLLALGKHVTRAHVYTQTQHAQPSKQVQGNENESEHLREPVDNAGLNNPAVMDLGTCVRQLESIQRDVLHPPQGKNNGGCVAYRHHLLIHTSCSQHTHTESSRMHRVSQLKKHRVAYKAPCTIDTHDWTIRTCCVACCIYFVAMFATNIELCNKACNAVMISSLILRLLRLTGQLLYSYKGSTA